eukprot:CAMPEP_0177526972 /NCGR_PEP_ID=MMETSP0369-20130122/51374_1 /TAXON_ID=447022 ORGANISM="Scrippsiella hangoei-like, Strain SHHI-4" /NCGR_SAMPLE_ID=MMETSP0369 /ASSEMBLY_ACC=CAM_ASM_000364 /LENGTH=31 /DNA_ID= /DNA_START= /DNA_END= /DNA_ORIENTATION=
MGGNYDPDSDRPDGAQLISAQAKSTIHAIAA